MLSVPIEEISNVSLNSLRNDSWNKMKTIYMNNDLIAEVINEIMNGASQDPQGIGPIFLKKGGQIVIDALVDILQISLDNSSIPQCLKDIWITPLWKRKTKMDPREYRPLAMSSHKIKTLERVIRKQMVNYLDDNNLLEQSQHGS